MQDEMDKIYNNNKRIIQKYDLKVGTKLRHKTQSNKVIITHIHSLYGWVIAQIYDRKYIGYEQLDQGLTNIDKFEVIEINNR